MYCKEMNCGLWLRIGVCLFLLFYYNALANSQLNASVFQYIETAEKFMKAKEYYNAIEYFSKAIKNSDTLSIAYLGRAKARLFLKDFSNAKHDIDQLLLKRGDNAEAYYLRGQIYINIQQYDKAAADIDKATILSPRELRYQNSRIFINFLQGNDKECLKQVENAISAHPDFGNFYFTRGVVTFKLKPEKSIEDFDRALSLHASIDSFEIFLNRGTAYLATNEDDKAVEDFNNAIKLNPNNSISYNNRARVYYKQGKYEEALSDFQKSIELGDNTAITYYNLGMVCLKMKNTADACNAFQKSCKLGNTEGCKKIVLDCSAKVDMY